jgi:hypothetical protein
MTRQTDLWAYDRAQATLDDAERDADDSETVTGVTTAESVATLSALPERFIHGYWDSVDGCMRPVDPACCLSCEQLRIGADSLPCFFHYRLRS